MSEEKTEKKTKGRKIRSIIEWVVSGVFIATALVLIVFRIVQSSSGKAYPIFGSYYCTVMTDSMEPDYMVKDVLVVKKVNPDELKVGDDITFYWKNIPYPITHRIEEIRPNESEDPTYKYVYVVHGINTQSNQCDPSVRCDITGQKQYPTDNALVGKVVRKSGFLKIITSVWGLIFLILIPSGYLLVTTVLDMFKKLDEQEEENKFVATSTSNASLNGLSEKEIEKLKKDLLKEMLSKGKK